MTALTSRERVNRMMERRDQDRIPRYESFWPETITRWEGEGLVGGVETVYEKLESDCAYVAFCLLAPFPGEERIVSENEETKVVRDGHGKLVRHWKHKSGTPEHLGFECETREIWEKTFKPALLKNWLQIDIPAAKERFERGQISLIAMAMEPEWIEDVAVTSTDVWLRNLDAAYAAGIHLDGLWTFGDMAFKSATMCSPAMYRELIWPQHKRLADWAHSHGMKLIFHSDGDVNGVMDLYIEAGFDCLQPLEAKASMDIRKLCPAYGDKLSFMGNIDVMKRSFRSLLRAKPRAGMPTIPIIPCPRR